MVTSNVVAVSRCACAAAEHVGRQVVNLLAVLIANDGAASGSCVSSQHHSVLYKESIFLVNTMTHSCAEVCAHEKSGLTLKMIPQMVVPVFMVLTGVDIPADAAIALFLMQLSKLKPPVGSVER